MPHYFINTDSQIVALDDVIIENNTNLLPTEIIGNIVKMRDMLYGISYNFDNDYILYKIKFGSGESNDNYVVSEFTNIFVLIAGTIYYLKICYEDDCYHTKTLITEIKNIIPNNIHTITVHKFMYVFNELIYCSGYIFIDNDMNMIMSNSDDVNHMKCLKKNINCNKLYVKSNGASIEIILYCDTKITYLCYAFDRQKFTFTFTLTKKKVIYTNFTIGKIWSELLLSDANNNIYHVNFKNNCITRLYINHPVVSIIHSELVVRNGNQRAHFLYVSNKGFVYDQNNILVSAHVLTQKISKVNNIKSANFIPST